LGDVLLVTESLHLCLHGVQVHTELAAASAGLQAAAASHSADAAGAAARLDAAGLCAQQLLGGAKQLLETLAQLGAAVAAATEREAAWQGASQAEAEAIAAAAGLVGLAPDDIRSVMLPHAPAHHSSGAASSLEAAAQQAWAVLRQVESQLEAGDWQGQGQASASLLVAIALLSERCAQAQAALAAAQHSSGSDSGGAGGGSAAASGHLAFEDLQARLRAAAAEVADLEARIG
jgi:hypothetical protein